MEWLQKLLDAAGRNQAQLALHLKIAPPRVSEMIRGARRMQPHEIKPASEFFGLSTGVLQALIDGDQIATQGAIELVAKRAKDGAAADTVHLVANDTGNEAADYPTARMTFPSLHNGPEDIPLWASAAAGDEGAMILVPDPIGYLRRSERMLAVAKPFAFNVIGASMSPAIEHGDQVVINPSVVARTGHDCVFIHEGADGMFALLKRLLRPNSEHWHVRQFNPAKDFTIPRRKWSRVHPIAEIKKAGV